MLGSSGSRLSLLSILFWLLFLFVVDEPPIALGIGTSGPDPIRWSLLPLLVSLYLQRTTSAQNRAATPHDVPLDGTESDHAPAS